MVIDLLACPTVLVSRRSYCYPKFVAGQYLSPGTKSGCVMVDVCMVHRLVKKGPCPGFDIVGGSMSRL